MLDYKQFREQYIEQHPASVPVRDDEISPYASWVKWVALLMFASGSLMSGVHTAPSVYDLVPEHPLISEGVRTFAAVFSFVSVELAILLSAYFMIKGNRAGLFFLLVSGGVAMVANVTSVFAVLERQFEVEPVLKTLIFGLGAPTIAFMSGKMFVNIHTSARTLDRRARDKFKQESIAFDAAILDAWTAYQNQRPTAVQMDSGHGQRSGHGYKRSPDASKRARRYFTQNPDALFDDKLSVRRIADEVDAGKSTVHAVRGQMREELEAQKNGHGERIEE